MNTRISTLMKGINQMEEKDDNTYRVIYEMNPVSKDMRRAGIGGTVHYKELMNSDNTKIAGISMRNIDLALRKMQIQSGSFDEVVKAAVEKEKLLASIPTIMPVSKEKIRITSLFGWRKNPFNRNTRSFHSGVDFAGKPGTPIYATGDGVVEGNSRMSGYGIVVLINHGYGYKTMYAHLSKASVKPGEKIKRGQVIGKLGTTGASTGPHLHYEVLKNGQRVNPMNYITSTLSKEEYNTILMQAEELQ
jgi:murein DD-endopeptidase MepM/ murein hydrolase activator NlpD